MKMFDSLEDVDFVALLLSGKVGVMPTDTVYGLVAQAKNSHAVSRLYRLKSRERKPGTIIAANTEQLIDLGVDKTYLSSVDKYWPGSISVVTAAGSNLDYLHQGIDSLALRIPADKILQKLLLITGPLLTSSANNPGELPASNIKEAQAYFKNQVDFYVDGGDISNRLASTVIRVEPDATITILRQGAAKIR